MLANYHTHTWRCGHARDTEEQYVENAIARGIKILGFSDHSPYLFSDGYYSHFRMKPEQTAEYAATVFTLRDRFQDQIEIHLGVEAEYYPAYFADTAAFLKDHGVEYMIMGQHFVGSEIGEPYSGHATDDEQQLRRYVHQVIEGMETGLFTYVAHPDLLRFTGDDAIYFRHMRTLCRKAREYGIPLEINLLGVVDGRHYPDERFWKIAGEEGCPAVLGCDAHWKEALVDVETEKRALELARRHGVQVLETVPLRKL